MTNVKLITLGLLSTTLMAACTTTSTTVGAENRAAVDEAMSKQIVSTEAVKGAPTLHPSMNAAAIKRYLEDDLKKPEVTGGFRPGN